ncbi:MAG: ComEC/Rec2 family competence protein [Solirubrobacterales bacterium]
MLAGLALGLAISPYWAPPGGFPQAAIALVLTLIVLIDRDRFAAGGIVLVFLAATLTGASAGGLRLEAIDRGALEVKPGTTIQVTGFTTAVAKRSRGVTRVPVQTESGKVMVEASRAPPRIATGSGVAARGVARGPPGFLESSLSRQGISRVVYAEVITLDGKRRGGVAGWIDSMRIRAEAALSRGMPPRESALARGFVLGQDDSIDEKTTEDFRASGLAHLLAVSGQNVVLLGLLAIPFMAMAGLGPRSRLGVVAALILVYVPLAGAGASIQRAGVMGLAGLLAVAATRPGSRVYALVLAAAVTLGANPRSSTDIGWQLSFAAVIGIYLLTGPLQARLRVLIGTGGWRTGLTDATAVTVAATLATAPLMAFHFEEISVTTLAANLLAVPAVAPAMWLGMISAALGQVAGWMALPFNLLNSLFLSYVAQVAAWFGGPSWARLEVRIGSPYALVLIYMSIAAVVVALLKLLTPRRLGDDPDPRRRTRARQVAGGSLLALVGVSVLFGPSLFGDQRRQLAAPPEGGARVEVLDVGQGDAILIRPATGDPVLVDGGPPGGDVEGALESAGVEGLSAVILTHDHLDHFGGLYDVFGHYEVERFLFDRLPRSLLALSRESGAEPVRIAQGFGFRAGEVSAEVLWPPRLDQGEEPPEDPNDRSVVVGIEVGRFRMLLTGDAEAEVAPVNPGPLDVLKVAHHGSDDAGLPVLLTGSDPELALISAGEDNSYGHPTARTTSELGEGGVDVLRTDQDGTISIVVSRNGYKIETGN